MTSNANKSPVRMLRPVPTNINSTSGVQNEDGVNAGQVSIRNDIFQPDAFAWSEGRPYSYGAEVQVTGSPFSVLGSEGNIAYRRSLQLNRPNVRTEIDGAAITFSRQSPRGNLGNIYRCVIPHGGTVETSVNPDIEELQKADPNHLKFSGRKESDPEGFVPPTWVFVRKVIARSFTDQSPSHANGIFNEVKITITSPQASDTFAAIGITGTRITLSHRTRGVGRGSFFRSADLSDTAAPSNWGELIQSDPDYARNYIFRDLPNKAFSIDEPLIVTITNRNGFARLGQAVLARELVLGLGDASITNISATDYSPVILDDYGNVDRTIRNTADEERIGVKIKRSDISFLKGVFKDYRAARPAIFTIGNNEKHGETIYGYISGFNITHDTQTDDMANLVLDTQGLA
ncbi:MAG: hypothetical protein K0U41_09965 [Gammaproteobacteria bacterium]|nr:hypothetical protein [Gammaproteobacteria bacterium]